MACRSPGSLVTRPKSESIWSFCDTGEELEIMFIMEFTWIYAKRTNSSPHPHTLPLSLEADNVLKMHGMAAFKIPLAIAD